jgi:hypothetical protein
MATNARLEAFRHLRCLAAALLFGLPGCGGGADPSSPPGSSHALDDAARRADVAVLMMGNSHTVGAGLPGRLQVQLQAALPGRSVAVVVAPASGFLDDHLADPATQALLQARRWSAVVLQAQKYSSSGTVSYSTAAAEALIRQVRALGAMPVLYPEWARQGIDEADRIWALHAGIAAREPACVAPVPQAWAAALARDAGLPLHDTDGNHAASAGAQLTALVLLATLTGRSPSDTPEAPDLAATARQPLLREAAAAAAAAQPPRALCPGQAPVG